MATRDFGERLAELRPGMVAILGIPSDHNSSYLRGSAQAPPRIRQVMGSGSSNLWSETGTDCGDETRIRDLGDLDFDSIPAQEVLPLIESTLSDLLERGVRVLSWGGDHAITYPIVKAYAKAYPGLGLLQLDAHPDLYDELDGNRYSHACPFARIMEEGLVRRLVQLGVRTMNPHQRSQAETFGVEVKEMRHLGSSTTVDLAGPLYVSVDLDVLDPAFAPGVAHHEPGGLSTRDVIRVIQQLAGPVVGADIVELNPTRDPLGTTAAVAAKLTKELAAALLQVAH